MHNSRSILCDAAQAGDESISGADHNGIYILPISRLWPI